MDYFAGLQHRLQSDLSKRVLLLHGLSGWPSIHGSYALCEVELSSNSNPAGNDSEIQFVVQAFPRISSVDKERTTRDVVRSGLGDSGGQEQRRKLRPQTDGQHAVRALLKDDANQQRLYVGVEGTRKFTEDSVIAKLSGRLKHFTRSDNRLAEGEDVRRVLSYLSILAPGVPICQASYDELVRMIKGVHCSHIDNVNQVKLVKTASLYQCTGESKEAERKSSEKFRQQLDTHGTGNEDTSYSAKSKHPNLAPILGALHGESLVYLVYRAMPFTVQSLLHYSPGALGGEDHIRLLIFQILSGLDYLHKQGLSHGDLRPSNLLLTENLWCMITGFFTEFKHNLDLQSLGDGSVGSVKSADFHDNIHPEKSITGSLTDWRGAIKRWWAGEISNYDYLLLLNKLAGRRWEDPCFHTVVPWVIDFSVKPEQDSSLGWRDLTKSKWRLAKGDEQLDFTYSSAEMPHHVSDECLSELAVCIYKARRLPLPVLRRIVRQVYEPNEYPANMQRLYQWTPDECVPEFYSDSHIFESTHQGMNNLAVPTWAAGPEDFIKLHKTALESDRVSQQIHHWIDLTFGFKLSGKAAVDAKNVTLTTVGPTVPRSSGRRQLFSKPHPRRLHSKTADVVLSKYLEPKSRVLSLDNGLSSTVRPLEALEEITSFSEAARHLSPVYNVPGGACENLNLKGQTNQLATEELSWHSQNSAATSMEVPSSNLSPPSLNIVSTLLKDSCSYRELVEKLYADGGVRDKECFNESHFSSSKRLEQKKEVLWCGSEDILAAGCLIAELYLRKPLFDPVTASAYSVQGILPDHMDCLSPNVRSLVERALDKDLSRRPTASVLLESSFFTPVIHAVYYFLAPLNLLTNRVDRLQYVTTMARQGAFVSMGPSGAEMCTPTCLSLLVPPFQDIDVEAVVLLITKLLRALKACKAKKLLVPVFQKLLQSQESPSLKVALLQVALIKELWRVVGTACYLQNIHSSVLASLRRAPNRSLATAAAKLLVSMCLDLGVPITLHQTLLPLLQAFGRDITVDHMEVMVGIGEQFGEKLVTKHLLPSLRSIVASNVDCLITERPGPVHSWRLLAMVDSMAVLDRLRNILSPGIILRELLQEPYNVYMKVLLHPLLPSSLLQCAAKALLLVCEQVGAEATVSFVLPQLKLLFDGLAFAGKLEGGLENGKVSKSSIGSANQGSHVLQIDESTQSSSVLGRPIQSLISSIRSGGTNSLLSYDGPRADGDIALVHTLYPGLASLVGIERLRQGLTTWLLLEQALLKHYNWKWEGSGGIQFKKMEKIVSTEITQDSVNPANLLLDGVGWSIPQSQASKWSKSPGSSRRLNESTSEKSKILSDSHAGDEDGSWSWLASKDSLWGAESFGRIGAGLGLAQEDCSWNLSSTIVHSWKAYTGLIRSIVIPEDENTVYTAGGGLRGGSVVRQWKLSSSECVTEYAGHEEAVNDICILSGGRRVASCDGTLHIWNAQTGQRVAFFDECLSVSSTSSMPSSSSSVANGHGSLAGESGKVPIDVHNASGVSVPNHSLTATLTGGGLYTCMHGMEAEERLVTGMVNGSLRFFEVEQGRQSYYWRCEPLEASLTSLVSAIASSGQGESMEGRKYSVGSSWIAVGFASGFCRLLDYKSGSVVTQWRAHEGFITKFSVLEERYLISSSLDKTISLWDLRRITSPERVQVYRGHKRGVISFAMKGCDILSAAGSKIGLSSLSSQGGENQTIEPQKLYSAEPANRLLSNISAIAVLPFSRLFLIGTDDGYLKICT